MVTKCEERMKETKEWKCIADGHECILEIAVVGFDPEKYPLKKFCAS